MVTSCPSMRLVMAMGMSAPWSRPRVKPAGSRVWSSRAVDRCTTQTMTAPTARMVRDRTAARRSREGRPGSGAFA